MRLHESDYIRLWHIAVLNSRKAPLYVAERFVNEQLAKVQELPKEELPSPALLNAFTNACQNLLMPVDILLMYFGIMPPEDEDIFTGLLEVYRRFIPLFKKCESRTDDDNAPSNGINNQGKRKTRIYENEDIQRSHDLTERIQSQYANDITIEKITELSFGLFTSIPQAVDFYVQFQNIINMFYFICLLRVKTNVPLRGSVLHEFQDIFSDGWVNVKKYRNNITLFELNKEIREVLSLLIKIKPGDDIPQYIFEECNVIMSEIHNNMKQLKQTKHTTDKQRLNISKGKKSTPESKAIQERNETIRQDIKKLKDSKGCSQHAACEKYLLENREFLKEQGINSAKYLEYICSGGDPNKQRTAINNGASIQTPLNSSEWKKFRKEYEEWRKLTIVPAL